MTLSAAALVDILQGDLTRKTNSFAEYVTHCSPYVPPGCEPMVELIAAHAAQDREQAVALGEMIYALGGIPNPGMFDESVADTNYLSIVYLFDLYVRLKRESVESYEARVDECSGHPAVRALVLRILEREQQQLAEAEAALAARAARA